MKKAITTTLLAVALALCACYTMLHSRASWSGVDETVVGRYARQAGRAPSEPLINTDRGDLLLFFFLIAGAGAGFAGGYYFRELFPPRKERGRA